MTQQPGVRPRTFGIVCEHLTSRHLSWDSLVHQSKFNQFVTLEGGNLPLSSVGTYLVPNIIGPNKIHQSSQPYEYGDNQYLAKK